MERLLLTLMLNRAKFWLFKVAMGFLFATTMGVRLVVEAAESNILREHSLTQTGPKQRPIALKGRTFFVSEAQYFRYRGGAVAFGIGCMLLVCSSPLYKSLQSK